MNRILSLEKYLHDIQIDIGMKKWLLNWTVKEFENLEDFIRCKKYIIYVCIIHN